MYREEREILLLQREKYKYKLLENLVETRSKVVSKKGVLTAGGAVLAGFLAYKGLGWLNKKAAEETKDGQSKEPAWMQAIKENVAVYLLEVAKDQVKDWLVKRKD